MSLAMTPAWPGPCGPGRSSSSGDISGHGEYQAHSGRVALATLQQGNCLRMLTISAISEIQCQSELSEATGQIRARSPSNQAIKRGVALLSQRYHVHVASTTTATMDCTPNFHRWEYFVLKIYSTGSRLETRTFFRDLLVVLTFQTEEIPNHFSRVVVTAP